METYKDKIVCFIDILGFKSMVEVQYLEAPVKLYEILSKIRMAIRDWERTAIASNIDLQITQFSDSIIFSFIPTGHYFMTLHFFKELCIAMIGDNVVFRGGITYGKIFHDKEFVFGPAMNEAYRLENEQAKFPRIIIDDKALGLKNDDGKTILDYPDQPVFKIESSGYSYVNYITDVVGYVNPDRYYENLKTIISNGLAHDIESVRAKYEWMKIEYNKAKENFQELSML